MRPKVGDRVEMKSRGQTVFAGTIERVEGVEVTAFSFARRMQEGFDTLHDTLKELIVKMDWRRSWWTRRYWLTRFDDEGGIVRVHRVERLFTTRYDRRRMEEARRRLEELEAR